MSQSSTLIKSKNYKYRIYSCSQKQEILKELKQDLSDQHFHYISLKYGTKITNLKRWLYSNGIRKPGCGRKRFNPEAVLQLENWIIDQARLRKKKLSRNEIRTKALELINVDNFCASKAWMDQFVHEHDIKWKVNCILDELGCLSQLQSQKHKQQKHQRLRKMKRKQHDIQVKVEEQPIKIEEDIKQEIKEEEDFQKKSQKIAELNNNQAMLNYYVQQYSFLLQNHSEKPV